MTSTAPRKLDLKRDVEMSIRFKTHCPRCGLAFMIESLMCVADKSSFQFYIEEMRSKLERASCRNCETRLPEIGEEWGGVWP